MKTKKVFVILAVLTVAAFVFGAASGISLSSYGEKENNKDVALIGMFVTKDYLNGRIDAVLEEYTEVDEDTGEKLTHKEYVFMNTEGFPFYHCEINDDNGNYGFTFTDGIISDVNSISNISDDTEENIIEGTLYTVNTDGIFYANPVFQNQKGEVWLEPGDGFSASGYGSSSIKLGNEIKITTENKVSVKKHEAQLTIEYADPVKELIISEMNEKDVLIRKTIYPSDEIASEYTPSEEACYIIVNTIYYDVENALQEKRNVYDKTDDSFSYMSIREDGIGIKLCSEIMW